MAKYWDGIANEFKDIPVSNYYVLSNDKYMSKLYNEAKNTNIINTVVVPCKTMEKAKQVEAYAENRDDQTYIRIVGQPPRNKAHVLYSLQLGWLNNKAKYN